MPESKFMDVFIYLHAVTIILGSIYLLFWIASFTLLNCKDYSFPNNIITMEKYYRAIIIKLTCIWSSIVRMLNMSLQSGNDYYWTKSILAINLILPFKDYKLYWKKRRIIHNSFAHTFLLLIKKYYCVTFY